MAFVYVPRGWLPLFGFLALFTTAGILGAERDGAGADLLSRQWVTVELAVVRHQIPDAGGEALVVFDPREMPRRLMLLEGSVLLPSVVAPALPPQWGEVPVSEAMPPAWMWADPPAPAPVFETLLPNVPGQTLAPMPDLPPEPTPMEEARAALQAFEDGLVHGRSRWLRDDLGLAGAMAGLRRSGDFAVLAHGRWVQALPPSRRPLPRFAQFGVPLPGGVFEMEGTVSVSEGRYIDVAVDFMAPAPPVAGEAWQLARDGYAVLEETRRTRYGEVHYFDHPRFGVVVRVQRVTPPEALLERLNAAQESL